MADDTGITASGSATAQAVPGHRRHNSLRKRVSVPRADVSTLEWMDAQENISFSVRALIHDYIEHEGYSDPTARPVTQLPRRGRPPREGAAQAASVIHEAGQQTSEPSDAVRESDGQSGQSAVSPQPGLNPGSTPGAEGVGAFLAASRD